MLSPLFGAGAFDDDGHWLSEFLQLDFALAIDFKSSWERMQEEVMDSTLGGPLLVTQQRTLDAHVVSGQLQRALTRQREDCWQRQMHAQMMAWTRA